MPPRAPLVLLRLPVSSYGFARRARVPIVVLGPVQRPGPDLDHWRCLIAPCPVWSPSLVSSHHLPFDLFAGMKFSDQPAGCPLILLFIEPAKQCFLSQNQPVSAKIVPAEHLHCYFLISSTSDDNLQIIRMLGHARTDVLFLVCRLVLSSAIHPSYYDGSIDLSVSRQLLSPHALVLSPWRLARRLPSVNVNV
jgi:hypothetical protein